MSHCNGTYQICALSDVQDLQRKDKLHASTLPAEIAAQSKILGVYLGKRLHAKYSRRFQESSKAKTDMLFSILCPNPHQHGRQTKKRHSLAGFLKNFSHI
jgi:hypothetical protein